VQAKVEGCCRFGDYICDYSGIGGSRLVTATRSFAVVVAFPSADFFNPFELPLKSATVPRLRLFAPAARVRIQSHQLPIEPLYFAVEQPQPSIAICSGGCVRSLPWVGGRLSTCPCVHNTVLSIYFSVLKGP
jgi:hypothetical protein